LQFSEILMNPTLKPLPEQTIVLTGATSGIGLVTARMAAEAGARLVLAARNEEALETLSNELQSAGAEVAYVVADVGKEEDVRPVGGPTGVAEAGRPREERADVRLGGLRTRIGGGREVGDEEIERVAALGCSQEDDAGAVG